MGQYIVTLSDEEEKALLTNMVSIQEWLDNAIQHKAAVIIDRIIEKNTDKQPRKMEKQNKLDLIKSMTLETAVERNTRLSVIS